MTTQTEMTLEPITLQDCCFRSHSYLDRPFVATDGHVAVSIEHAAVGRTLDDATVRLVRGVLTPPRRDGVHLDLAALKRWAGAPSPRGQRQLCPKCHDRDLTPVRCDRCEGGGLLDEECDLGHRHEVYCSDCDGEGQVSPECTHCRGKGYVARLPRHAILLGIVIDRRCLARAIALLTGETVSAWVGDLTDPIVLVADNGRAVFAPLSAKPEAMFDSFPVEACA